MATYCVAVRRDFIAQHFLIGGDWGAENDLHAHHYQVELRLRGPALDTHGYLVDIVDIEHHLDGLVSHFRDRILNEMAEMTGLNPSIEHLARIFGERLAPHIPREQAPDLEVVIWENDIAWASYRLDREAL